MSKLIAPRFLPWLRIGLAAHIAEPAKNGLAPDDMTTVSVDVQLHASGKTDFKAAVPSPSIRLRGPGEVVGIDAALVARRDPEPGTNDAEDSYLALIEFRAPDLPWRYTPAAATNNRLQPWIALVVVEEREGVWLETTNAGRLPILHIDDLARELPELRQCWAWAHVQADYELGENVAAAFTKAPEAFRSRLLCPRRLVAHRSWLACVVPTFEAGRRAGLGEPISANMGLAWNKAKGGTLRLPVYDSWRFQTGPGGDIEALVRRLKPRELPANVGRRALDISEPGGGLPSIKGSTITYKGALVSPLSRPDTWPTEPPQRIKSALRDVLNGELVSSAPRASYDARRDDPVVGPPAYAALQAQRRTVPAEGAPPAWFGELNTEPQHRAAAGLGAAVVRRDQEALMAIAWEHAADAFEANRILNRARAAWEVARRALPRFRSLPDEMLVQIAGPAMARLRHSSGKTIKGAVAGSALPSALLSGTFRRLSNTIPGFVTVTANERIASTAAVTRAALAEPVKFVGRWADVRPPAGAGMGVPRPPSSSSATARVQGAAIAVSPRTQPVAIPYSGDSETARLLADSIEEALNPLRTITAMVHARVGAAQADQDVPTDRLFVRPVFTNPMYRRLVALSVEYLVPGIGAIPSDTLGLLETNPPFIEAFVAGLNHELGRELLWREYPARPDGTWFQYFWEGGPQASPDVNPIRYWKATAGLGANAPREGSQASKDKPQSKLVLLIKSALLRRYPDLRVYAVEAAWAKDHGKDVRREAANGKVSLPLFAARLSPDVVAYGFDLREAEARGSTKPSAHPGYFFVLEQQPGAPRFGLDAKRPERAGAAPTSWANLSWSHLVKADAPLPAFIDVAGPPWLVSAGALGGNSDELREKGKDAWGEDAAAMARITYQRPVRMLVHADAILPDTTTKDKP